jgi:hypothetical protein
MLSKKIFFSAAFVSMAGLVACGDDSSSNSGSGELPKSVPTFFDLADVECNADRKCETIIVEEGPDTYECDGVSQWNMLINSMPSKVCPAKEEEKGTEGDEEGKTEGDDNKTPESSASETTSTDSGAESTDSNTESTDSGEKSSGSAPVAMISCDNLPEEGQKAFGTMGEKCTEFEKGSMAASALELRCEDHGGTLGTGCPAKESNGNCIDKSQCDAIVRGDFSTWHFVRADAFGEPTTYTYSVDGSKLILDIDGEVNENTYSFYDMTKEASQEMAFSAVKSTCKSGMEIEGANYCD